MSSHALGLFCLGLLLIWIPQYLTWPWFRDTETFAVLAQSWDRGILPYRDIKTFNFPGAIYLAWTLGKVFGWGHTLPLYAFDAGCVVVIGLVMVTWSRRKLGGAVPGLIGYLAFLNAYLNLRYEVIAAARLAHGVLAVPWSPPHADVARAPGPFRVGRGGRAGTGDQAACGAVFARARLGGLRNGEKFRHQDGPTKPELLRFGAFGLVYLWYWRLRHWWSRESSMTSFVSYAASLPSVRTTRRRRATRSMCSSLSSGHGETSFLWRRRCFWQPSSGAG